MIKVNIKKMVNLRIPLSLLLKIGDVTIKENYEVYCRGRESRSLEIFGEFGEGWPSIIQIYTILLEGLDREYEKDYKNLCAWSLGEIYAIISVNNGERLLKFKSINGEMYEEEITVEVNS